VSLALTGPWRLCLCRSLCYKLSPFQAHWERWHCTCVLRPACLFTVHVEVGLPPSPVEFSSHCHFLKLSCSWLLGGAAAPASAMFVYSSREKWFFPPLLWSFPPSATLTSFPTPGCWVRAPAPARASLVRLACLFIVPGRIPFPQSSELSAPHPLSHVSLFLLLISQFLFFPWVEVSLSRGLCCSGPGLSVGVPWYHEAHLVCVPKLSGCGWLAARGPSWFLRLMWSGDSLHWLEVWRGQSYASSQWLCLQSVSPASLQDFTIGGSLSASSL
jgi:hypothetical protein